MFRQCLLHDLTPMPGRIVDHQNDPLFGLVCLSYFLNELCEPPLKMTAFTLTRLALDA